MCWLSLTRMPDAQPAMAKALSEALVFSGVEAAALDVVFLTSEAELTGKLAEVGLRFDLPASCNPIPPLRPRPDQTRTTRRSCARSRCPNAAPVCAEPPKPSGIKEAFGGANDSVKTGNALVIDGDLHEIARAVAVKNLDQNRIGIAVHQNLRRPAG